ERTQNWIKLAGKVNSDKPINQMVREKMREAANDLRCRSVKLIEHARHERCTHGERALAKRFLCSGVQKFCPLVM
ncbi:hypothetical protein ACCS83_28210, partial [Rhizobium johnstonii]|uniref:hypothetical protein n=1 Tax=Rhizobium johnstonii TaxID=3019933 RepID=UPI003F9D67CB